MSPIGRVFIVLNLVLAGGFVGVAGTYLQKQHNFKTKYEAAEAQKSELQQNYEATISRLESERNTFENAKTANETQLAEARNQIGRLQDENKRLSELSSSQGADIKKLTSLAEAANSQSKAAHDQARDAYQMAIADQKAKDEAIRAKDAAEAENRTLKTQIASLNETIERKNVEIASLQRNNSELGILVKAAEANGFVPAMAAPNLAGTVTNASGRLCTIAITDNPGNIDIQDHIEKRSFSFAIYDSGGYKGEAVATKFEPSANAVLCNVFLVKDAAVIREGDRAATKTP